MEGQFSARDRERILSEMAESQLDVLIIGGGITGAGIAWDAASRGLKTGLLEMNDFASGTSSRSTKLIHGGLRYLKQGEVKLVMEVGRERALLHSKAPHIVIPAPMMLPIYKGGTYGMFTSSIGIYIYDMLAGVKRSERRKMFNKDETLRLEPLFKEEGLKGAAYYYEYRTDDARLTVEIMKTAAARGAKIVNYAKAEEFIYNEKGKVVGVKAKDRVTGNTVEIYAKKIVNAAGPWVDQVRNKDGSLQGKRLLLTKGVHLVFDYAKLPVKQAAYFDVPDGRMVFVIPRGNKTYVGTTDTVYKGDIGKPRITVQDRDYLLAAVNNIYDGIQLKPEDIESGWSGLRPLIYEEGKGPSEISRKDEIFISDSGLITIAGGKLTGFRVMALKVVDLVTEQLKEEQGLVFDPCTTDQQPISGGDLEHHSDVQSYREEIAKMALKAGISREDAEYLFDLYGSNTLHIIRNYNESEEEDSELRLLYAELRYAIDYEMAARAVDFLERRTALINFDIRRAMARSKPVLEFMKQQFGWTDQQYRENEAELEEAVRAATEYIKREE